MLDEEVKLLKGHFDKVHKRMVTEGFGPSYYIGYMEGMLMAAVDKLTPEARKEFLEAYRLNKHLIN